MSIITSALMVEWLRMQPLGVEISGLNSSEYFVFILSLNSSKTTFMVVK